MITLCFDFGNTRRKLAVFEGSELSRVQVMPDDSTEAVQALIDEYKPRKSILSSVVVH